MVHIWGGAWNDDANPSIEKDLGIKDGYHYFNTEQEKDNFCRLLDGQFLLVNLYIEIKSLCYILTLDMSIQRKVLYFNLQKTITHVIVIGAFLLEKNMERILYQSWIVEKK